MMKKKRNSELESSVHEWPDTWFPLRDQTIVYPEDFQKFTSPQEQIDWTNPVYGYHQEYLEREARRQPNSLHKHSMAKIVPWLLSMALLKLPGFLALNKHDGLARELQAPSLPIAPDMPIPSSETFFGESSPSPQTDSFGNSLEKKLPGTLNISPFSENHLDFRSFAHGRFEDEYVGPAMELVYGWTFVDFEFGSIDIRDDAIYNGDYIAENILPLGLGIWKDKIFLTLPKWKDGIPATLATVPRHSKSKSPKLKPYPSWEWNQAGSCEGFTSVFRVYIDECDRLWVQDSGKINIATTPRQVCPPSLFIFDLNTDQLIRRYTFPEDQNKEDSLYTNIVVDVRNKDCGSATAYISDVFRFGLVVYDFFKDTSFRVDHNFFYPDPFAAKYDVHGVKFTWTDGIFSLALSPVDVNNDRTLFFHPMSSFREFAVTTSIFTDKKTVEDNYDLFLPIGRPRAKDYGHSAGSAVDRNGVMFFNMVTRDSVWCWDTRKEYIPQNLGVVGTSNVSMVFPNDVRVDQEDEQNVWVLSDRLPMYLYGSLDPVDFNFRLFKASVKDAVKDTVCDPNYVVPEFEQGYDETC